MWKACCYKSCKNTAKKVKKDPSLSLQNIFFLPFPKPSRQFEKCKKWVSAVNSAEFTITSVSRNHYVCSKHFRGGKGPTSEYPDPIRDEDGGDISEKHHELYHAKSEDVDGNVPPIIKEDFTCTIKPDEQSNFQEFERLPSECSDAIIENGSDISEKHHELYLSEIKDLDVNIPSGNSKEVTNLQTQKLFTTKDLRVNFLQYMLTQAPETFFWYPKIVQNNPNLFFEKTVSFGNYITIEIQSSLHFKILPCNQVLKENHPIFLSTERFISSLGDLLNIMVLLDSWSVCEGIDNNISIESGVSSSSLYLCKNTSVLRSTKCCFLFQASSRKVCTPCRLSKNVLQARIKRIKKKADVNIRTNHRFMNSNEMSQKVSILKKKYRLLGKRFQTLQRKIQSQINKNGLVLLDSDTEYLKEELLNIPFETPDNFRKILLQEQLRILKSKTSRPKKWHPAIIQWCIYMKAKSNTTYKALKIALPLPSESTLRDYSKELNSRSGFSDKTLIEMQTKIGLKNLKEQNLYFSLILDEMQVKQDLVFRSSTGELVGFQHLNSFRNGVKEIEAKIQGNHNDSEDEIPLTSHILQLIVHGLTTDFKFVYAFFPCKTLKCEDLYSMVWEAISNLGAAGFNILIVVSDNAAMNMRFIRQCTEAERLAYGDKVGYRSVNIFNPIEPVYFIPDVCHLFNTFRNNILNSGSNRNTRCLQRNSKNITWEHMIEMFQKDNNSIIRLAPKLTYSHIYPSPSDLKRVKFSTQILSSTVAAAMESLLDDGASETIKLTRLMDQFFDMANTKNQTEGKKMIKKTLEPYRCVDDWRFKWLEDVFLKYFDDWEEEVKVSQLPDGINKTLMIPSKATLDGIRMTVYSLIGATKFLINKGVDFVLSAKFYQDPIEIHFGKVQESQGCVDNSTLSQIEHGDKNVKTINSSVLRPTRNLVTFKAKKRIQNRIQVKKRLAM